MATSTEPTGCLTIDADGVYLDGQKLPATDTVTIEQVDPHFHIVDLQLCVRTVNVTRDPKVSKHDAAVYRSVQIRDEAEN